MKTRAQIEAELAEESREKYEEIVPKMRELLPDEATNILIANIIHVILLDYCGNDVKAAESMLKFSYEFYLEALSGRVGNELSERMH